MKYILYVVNGSLVPHYYVDKNTFSKKEEDAKLFDTIEKAKKLFSKLEKQGLLPFIVKI